MWARRAVVRQASIGWLWLVLGCAFGCSGGPGEGSGAEDPAESDPPELRAAVERARVRGLMAEIEATHTPESIPEEEVRELWERTVEGQPLPARKPFEAMEAELREELANRRRTQALVDLVAGLEERIGVERDAQAIEELATLPLAFEEEGP